MSFIEHVQTLRTPLATHITTFLEEKKKHRPTLAFSTDVLTRLADFATKGKLIRGIAVLLAYEMYTGKINNDALYAAAAIELTHSSLLIHDDIMDNDYTRRGTATMFSQYANTQKDTIKDSLFYGQSMGICAGDIGFFLAFELLSKISTEQELLRKVMNIFAQELQYVGAAQMFDFHYGQTSDEPTQEEILAVYRYKTGRYTFSLPFTTGALLAGAPQEEIKTLDALGEHLGVLFQIHDDYLGVFGTEEKTGKPVGSDIRENKKTLLRQMVLQYASPSEKQRLAPIYGNKNCTHEQLQYVQNLCKTYNILALLQEKKHSYTQQTYLYIDALTIADNFKKLLYDLVKYISNRDQ